MSFILSSLSVWIFSGEWTIVIACRFPALVTFHGGDNGFVEICIVVSACVLCVFTMLAFIYGEKISTALRFDFLDSHVILLYFVHIIQLSRTFAGQQADI